MTLDGESRANLESLGAELSEDRTLTGKLISKAQSSHKFHFNE